jgi:hypothetical protein
VREETNRGTDVRTYSGSNKRGKKGGGRGERGRGSFIFGSEKKWTGGEQHNHTLANIALHCSRLSHTVRTSVVLGTSWYLAILTVQ